MFRVAISFNYFDCGIPELERIESVTFILPRHCPAVSAILVGLQECLTGKGKRPSLVSTPKFNLLPQLITNRKTPFPKHLWEHAWINPLRIVVHNSRTVAFLLLVQGPNMIIFFLFYFFEASSLLCRSYVQMLTIAVYWMHEMLTCICYSAFMPHNVARINCPSKCDRISTQAKPFLLSFWGKNILLK